MGTTGRDELEDWIIAAGGIGAESRKTHRIPRPDPNPEWREEAACKGMDPELFYGDGFGTNATIKEAKRVCYTVCTVRLACLEYALGAGENLGVFGGTTPKQRARIVRERRREAS